MWVCAYSGGGLGVERLCADTWRRHVQMSVPSLQRRRHAMPTFVIAHICTCFTSSVPFYRFLLVFKSFCVFSGWICVYDFMCVAVCVLNCMSCCHYGVIKHNNTNNKLLAGLSTRACALPPTAELGRVSAAASFRPVSLTQLRALQWRQGE